MAKKVLNGQEIKSKIARTNSSLNAKMCPAKWNGNIGHKNADGSITNYFTSNTHFIWTASGKLKASGRTITDSDIYKIASLSSNTTAVTIYANASSSGRTTLIYDGVLTNPTISNKPSWISTTYASSTGYLTFTGLQNTGATRSQTIGVKFSDTLTTLSINVTQLQAPCTKIDTVNGDSCYMQYTRNTTGATDSFTGGPAGKNTVVFNPQNQGIIMNVTITRPTKCTGDTMHTEHLWLDICDEPKAGSQTPSRSYYHAASIEMCSPTVGVRAYSFSFPTSAVVGNPKYVSDGYCYGYLWDGEDFAHLNGLYGDAYIKFRSGSY